MRWRHKVPSETWVNTACAVIGLGSENSIVFAVTLNGYLLCMYFVLGVFEVMKI
jgi:hypothetical protein